MASTEPKTLSEAIQNLENATRSKSREIKEILGDDFAELKKALDDLKPHLKGVGNAVGQEMHSKKDEIESRITDNPWITVGIVGLVSFFFGWIFGFSGRRD